MNGSSACCHDSATHTCLVALEEYWGAAERGENDGEHPPKPPNADVAWEAATLCSKAIGQLLDFKKTAALPDSVRTLPRSLNSKPPRSSPRQQDRDGLGVNDWSIHPPRPFKEERQELAVAAHAATATPGEQDGSQKARRNDRRNT